MHLRATLRMCDALGKRLVSLELFDYLNRLIHILIIFIIVIIIISV
jgi:hypothetical protein